MDLSRAMTRTQLYRIILGLAAIYNIGFGLWACLWPGAFFELFRMAPPNYPAIWRCLGMVVGVYGLAYGYAALRIDRAAPFVAVGLAGKILGPLGWVLSVHSGEWPVRTLPLIVFNDVIWWLPFLLILLEGRRLGDRLRGAAPLVCALLNAAAALALAVALRPGTEAEPDPAARAAYIARHPALWRAGWALWIGAALSLLAFYGWWGARLARRGLAIAAFLIAAAGLASDLLAESLFIGWLPDDLEAVQRAGSLLTGAAANGLYTLAGILLTLATPDLRGAFRAWTWTVWASGVALTVTALAASVPGMVASSAALMILFCPWAVAMGQRLR